MKVALPLYYLPVPGPEPVLVENHDGALHVWRRLGLTSCTVVHVDAHHDLTWIDPQHDVLTIANYLCQAIRDGIARDVIWVVPDGSWTTREARGMLRAAIRNLIRTHGGSRARLHEEPRRFSTSIGATPLVVCALDTLPRCTEPVLLDIDTDFMILPRVEYRRVNVPCAAPWIQPDALAGVFRDWPAQAVTIAYSVEGGYTPLEWKYLGDDLACQLGAVRPASAAPLYQRARMHARMGSFADARAAYAEAVRRDASYATAYGSRGLVFLEERQLDEAEAAFGQMLELDPEHPHAHWGLARVAMARSQWRAAHDRLVRALARDPTHVAAWRDLGDVLIRLGRDADAGAAYTRSLKLALEGHEPVLDRAYTPTDRSRRDRGHGRTLAALARLDARAGRVREAEAGYRMAVAAGFDRGSVRVALARLLARRGHWRGAASEMQRAVAHVPGAIRRAVRHARRR